MAVDKKEKDRKLTEAERRRLERYQELCSSLEAEGYRGTELTVGIVMANVVTIVAAIPIAAVATVLYVWANAGRDGAGFEPINPLVLLLALVVLTAVHELVHGIAWSFFAPNRFADIEFGFMKEYLTPYCVCTCPLRRGGYIVGALAPLVTLGLIPTAAAIAMGSFQLFVIGLIMIFAAGGDMLIVGTLLRHGTNAAELLVLDHPTQAGSVVFER